jgi:hypothetical protein
MKKIILSSFLVACASLSNFASAIAVTDVTSCDERTGIDFSDADGYDVACHQTDKWQRLGGVENENRLGDSTYSTGSSPSWDAENGAATDQDNDTDDGVYWSTDGGVTWTNTGEITRGEEVIFKFTVSRSIDGNHEYDELKAWIDWNQDGTWTNDNSEIIQHSQWYKYQNSNDMWNGAPGYGDAQLADWNALPKATKIQECLDHGNRTYNTATGRCNNKDDYREYVTAAITVPQTATLDTLWLRARVVCSNSLSNHTESMNMTAYGYQDQGEVEDYAIRLVDKKPPSEVSEPAGILVMSSALIFIAGVRRRRAKS